MGTKLAKIIVMTQHTSKSMCMLSRTHTHTVASNTGGGIFHASEYKSNRYGSTIGAASPSECDQPTPSFIALNASEVAARSLHTCTNSEH